LDNAESHGKHLHLVLFITQIANHLEKLLGIPGFSSKTRWSRIIGVSIILEPPAHGFKPHFLKKTAVLGPISGQTYVEMGMVNQN